MTRLRVVDSLVAAIAVMALLSPRLFGAPISATEGVASLSLAFVALGVVPGWVVLRASGIGFATSLDRLALSISVSLAMVQATTLIAVSANLALSTLVDAILAITAIGAIAVAFLIRPEQFRRLTLFRLGAWCCVLGLSVVMWKIGNEWPLGAPFSEDYLHVAQIKRLLFDLHPSYLTLHGVHGFIGTYPFSGIHGFYAAVSHAASVDALFVYDKSRAFWAIAALSTMHALSRRVTGRGRLADMALISLAVLVAAGPLARIPGYYWGQLLPTPHVSDIGMNLLLPQAVLLALTFAGTRMPHRRLIIGFIAVGVMTTLILVHIRDYVQALVYLGALALSAAACRKGKSARDVAGLAAVSLVVALVYRHWHGHHISTVAQLVGDARVDLWRHVVTMSPTDWLAPFEPYVNGLATMAYGLAPLSVLSVALAKLAFPNVPTRMMLLSIAIYVVIIRIAPVSALYVAGTYDEILTSPYRNLALFGYLALGAVCVWGALWLTRLPHPTMVAPMAGILVGAGAGKAARWLESSGESSTEWLFAALAVASVIGLTVRIRARRPMGQIGGTALATVVSMTLSLGYVASKPNSSPLLLALKETSPSAPGAAGRWYHERFSLSLLDREGTQSGCRDVAIAELDRRIGGKALELGGGKAVWCAPSWPLVDWINREVGPHGNIMLNPANLFPGIPVFDSQIAVSVPLDSLREWNKVLPVYAALWGQGAGQPVFRPEASVAVIAAELKALAVTHLVVDPMYRSALAPILSKAGDLFDMRYDDGQWMVLAVVGGRG